MGKSIAKSGPLHAALRADYDVYRSGHDGLGDAAEALGMVIGVTRDPTYKILRGERPFPLHALPAWINETGSYKALEWACQQVGVIPVRMPHCSPLGCTAATVRDFASYLDGLATAQADGRISEVEAVMIRRRGEAAIATILAEIAHFEQQVSGPRSMAEAERAV